jgi:hypothetical protein
MSSDNLGHFTIAIHRHAELDELEFVTFSRAEDEIPRLCSA